ncbi:MAG: hypothetical protein ACREI7_00995, partial [Myxococcota bacterium]
TDVMMLAEDAGTGQKTSLPIVIASGVLRGESELVVSVDRTGLGDLEPSLRYLVEYPYGCLEQTLSRFVPLAKAKDLSTSLGLPGLAGTKMDAFLRAGVAKVARHQQSDGHFSLWPQSDTHPHLTVYALWGLTEAGRAGVDVPPETLERGLAALGGWLNAAGTIGPDNEGATAAMAAFVLAENGKADAGAMQRLYEHRARLPRWGQAFLLRAMIAGKSAESMIADVEKELAAGIVVDGDRAAVEDSHHADDHYYMTSNARATAIALSAWVARDPSSKLVPKLVRGLEEMRRPDGRWTNTQDNLWALIALSDYARTVTAGKGSVTIDAGAKHQHRKVLRGAEVFVARVPLDQVSKTVSIDADPGVRWTARLITKRGDDGAAVTSGFTVARAYLNPAGQVVTEVTAGEVVTVRLTVTADASREWIALVDPLPAGLEALNPSLIASGTTSTTNPWRWNHTEVRDDRVLWFADALSPGTFEMSYEARATIDGRFEVPPASIEAMYEPDVRGRTATAKLTVVK